MRGPLVFPNSRCIPPNFFLKPCKWSGIVFLSLERKVIFPDLDLQVKLASKKTLAVLPPIGCIPWLTNLLAQNCCYGRSASSMVLQLLQAASPENCCWGRLRWLLGFRNFCSMLAPNLESLEVPSMAFGVLQILPPRLSSTNSGKGKRGPLFKRNQRIKRANCFLEIFWRVLVEAG